jgi:hypothetical protein
MRLVGDRLYAVTFILDYIQLHFDDHTINAYAPLSVIIGSQEFLTSGPSFRDALCAQIGQCPSEWRLTAERLSIIFSSGEVRLSLRDEDYEWPEAGEISGPIAQLIFRHDDICIFDHRKHPGTPVPKGASILIGPRETKGDL